MLPVSFPDKRTALLGAFTSRLAIGLVIGCVQLSSWPGWAVGVLFGLLLSLPDAIYYAQVSADSARGRNRRPCDWRPNPRLEAPHLTNRCSQPLARRDEQLEFMKHVVDVAKAPSRQR